MQDNNKSVIGRLEYVDLPDFGLQKIVAKIDTGAYTGALHATDIKEVDISGQKMLEFRLLDEDHSEYIDKVHTVSDYEIKKVKSSNGDVESRYVIPVKLIIKNKTINAELTLNNRKEMRYPILIGRKNITNIFIVDVAQKFTE